MGDSWIAPSPKSLPSIIDDSSTAVLEESQLPATLYLIYTLASPLHTPQDLGELRQDYGGGL